MRAVDAGFIAAMLGLTAEQVGKYNSDGFLVVEDYADRSAVEALKDRANELLENFDPDSISIFSTKNQSALTDQYFFDSASKVSFFFEEKAFDQDGKLVQPKELSINKIGHALHDLDPVFRAFARSDRVKAILRSLGYRRPIPVQSMYICKQPNIGGEVVPHQDSTFLHTEPPSCIGLWWAVEDANRTNGCLWGLPGVHKKGCERQFIRKGDKVEYDTAQKKDWDLSQFVPLEVKAGTMVLLHGANVHYSAENTSPESRHAFSIHVVESAGTTWSPQNWLQRPEDFPFEPLYDDTAPAA